MFFLLLLGLGVRVHVDHWHEPCREMYYVIEEPFQMVAGDYCADLLTFIWSVRVLLRRENLILDVTAFPVYIRYPGSDGLYPQHSMGP